MYTSLRCTWDPAPLVASDSNLHTTCTWSADATLLSDRNPVQAAIQYYADDLPSPQVADVELACWRRKWLSADQDLPNSAVQALAECDSDFYPNVHKLLRILCTLPITSAECERSFSTLRRLKTYLRATMTSERESGLALMNIYYNRQIDISATVDIFARKHPRRLLLADILAD